MDPNQLFLIMMIIVLYFFTKICLAVITASQQGVLAVQASALIDFRRQGAIQRLEDMTFQGATQVEDQTINRREFRFPLFKTHHHTLPYPKTKENKT